MWLYRSFLLWLYAIVAILSLFTIPFTPSLILIFAAHIALLYFITQEYESRKPALSTLRCRMLTGAALSHPIQAFLGFVAVFIILGIVLVILAPFKVTDQTTPEDVQAQSDSFEQWITSYTNGVSDFFKTGGTLKVAAIIAVAVAVGALYETAVAWVLTRGYIGMAIGNGRLERISVWDVVMFTLIGAVGIQIGDTIIRTGVIVLAIGKASEIAPSEVAKALKAIPWWYAWLVEPLVRLIVLGKAVVAAAIMGGAVARVKVLERDGVLGAWGIVWGLYVLSAGVGMADNPESWKLRPWLSILGMILAAVVVALGGRWSAKKVRVLVGEETARTNAGAV